MSGIFSAICEQHERLQRGTSPDPAVLERATRAGRIEPPEGLSDDDRVAFLWRAGDLAHELERYLMAAGAFERLVALEEQRGEPEGLARACACLGGSLARAGELERATAAFSRGRKALSGGLRRPSSSTSGRSPSARQRTSRRPVCIGSVR